MPDLASDILSNRHHHWQQPLNRHPHFPTGWRMPPSNDVRTDPPQLSDRVPGHGGGSRGLQEPAEHRNRRRDFDSVFAENGPIIAVCPNEYDSDEEDEPVDSDEGVARYQQAFSDAEWYQIRYVFERLRRHEARAFYPVDDLNMNHQSFRHHHEESSQPSGTHSPVSSTRVNCNTSSPFSLPTSVAVTSTTTTTRSQTPSRFLPGIDGSSHFSVLPAAPRFLWLAPVLLHEITYTMYDITIAEEDIGELDGK